MVEVEQHRFAGDGETAENAGLPLLVYRGVLQAGEGAAAHCETLFAENGWRNGWRNGIYGFEHFHSTAHEVLGVVKGEARVRFGGEVGEAVELRTGDVVVIPAGVSHMQETSTRDLVVVGAYAAGRDYDTCTRRDAATAARISEVPKPAADPVYGDRGPLLDAWSITSR